MCPEVVGRSLHHQSGLISIGWSEDAVRVPRIDFTVGEHDSGGLDVGTAVDCGCMLDLVLHLLRSDAERLLADVQVHFDIVKTLFMRIKELIKIFGVEAEI